MSGQGVLEDRAHRYRAALGALGNALWHLAMVLPPPGGGEDKGWESEVRVSVRVLRQQRDALQALAKDVK